MAAVKEQKEFGENLLNHFESVAEIREKHKDQLAQVRGLVNAPVESDVTVYRFLRGYRFNVEKAAAALQRTLDWRKANNMEELRVKAAPLEQKDFPHADKLRKCYPHNMHHKSDRMGQPMSLERIGRIKPALLVKLVTLDEMLMYQKYHMEHKSALGERLTEQSGRVVRMCKVMDLQGLGVQHLHRAGMKYLSTVIHMSQDNYPEMLGNLYIINTPWIFQTAWRIVRPWLSPATLEKITILGHDLKKLHEFIDPANLPEWAGGTCTSCEGGCCIEEDPLAGMESVTVPARGKHEVTLEVDKGSVVSWEFTSNKDISFAATFTARGGETIEVVEPKKVESHKEAVTGGYNAVAAGALKFVWDNSYSYLTSKSLLFRLSQETAVEVEQADPEAPSVVDSPASDA